VDTRHGIRRRRRRPADGDATELHFRHHGLTPELGCIEASTRGWDHFLGTSLREYVEVGRGSPLGSSADKARRAADGAITPKLTPGNHATVRVSRAENDRIRRFYRDVLGCTLTRDGDLKDDFRMGDNFYIAFMYEDEGVALRESGEQLSVTGG